MRISKKILTIILSIGLLVVISCGDRPTGSDSGGNPIPSDYRGKYYSKSSGGGAYYWWLYINNDGHIECEQSDNNRPAAFNGGTFKGDFSDNTYTSNEQGANIKFEFKSDFSSVTVSGVSNEDLNGTYNQVE